MFVILLIVVVVAIRPAPAGVAEPTAAPLLLSIDPADITLVEVHASDGDLVLEKADGAWRIVSPLESAADTATIDDLLTTLISLPVDRTLPADVDPAELGLDPVSATVVLGGSGGPLATIEVGGTNPDETKRYVRLRGNDSILLVFSYQLDRLAAMVAQPPVLPTPLPEVTVTATAQS
ncbi:MAG: DUF4340 domain-containing protein [Anaerolineae bacterium]